MCPCSSGVHRVFVAVEYTVYVAVEYTASMKVSLNNEVYTDIVSVIVPRPLQKNA